MTGVLIWIGIIIAAFIAIALLISLVTYVYVLCGIIENYRDGRKLEKELISESKK